MPGQERSAAKAPGDRDSGTYNHKPKGRQKAARNSNIALHSITHTYRMEQLPGIEPKYKRNGLPYSYHINKDTKEKIASGLKVTIRQKQKTPAPACHRRRGFPLPDQSPVRSHHIAVRGCGIHKQPSHGTVGLGIEIIKLPVYHLPARAHHAQGAVIQRIQIIPVSVAVREPSRQYLTEWCWLSR